MYLRVMPHRKILLVLACLSALVVLFIQCGGERPSSTDPRGKYYAGSASCAGCHKDVMDSYMHTSHANTSAAISAGSLSQMMKTTNRSYQYNDSGIVTAESRDGGFFQTFSLDGQVRRSAQMEIAIGSGKNAQSYAYWQSPGLLRQLPLTYVSHGNAWTNSPGFTRKTAFFDRVVLSRCLECHASFVNKTDVPGGPEMVMEKMDPASVIYGIDCERCHGPSIDHVRYHEQFPDERKAKYVIPMASLSRQQKNDLCASCHSGNDQDMLHSTFGFRPGDTLSNYVLPSFGLAGKETDVHGKQMQRLMSSKCYQQSQMTCQSCHSGHNNEKNSQALFVSKCMACHKSSEHATGLTNDPAACLNCHMPVEVSKTIAFRDKGGNNSLLYMLRTHRIAVYPDSSSMSAK